MTSSPTIEREPEVVERPTRRPPPIIHIFELKRWERWLPPRFWRIRENDVALCGRRCKWTTPRGHHLQVKGEICVVCRDLSQSKP